jgi:hypothetical protein
MMPRVRFRFHGSICHRGTEPLRREARKRRSKEGVSRLIVLLHLRNCGLAETQRGPRDLPQRHRGTETRSKETTKQGSKDGVAVSLSYCIFVSLLRFVSFPRGAQAATRPLQKFLRSQNRRPELQFRPRKRKASGQKGRPELQGPPLSPLAGDVL